MRNGFNVVAIIGMNRSSSCGVGTTSDNDKEIFGRGVLMDRLREELKKRQIQIPMYGVKGSEREKLKAAIDKIIKTVEK